MPPCSQCDSKKLRKVRFVGITTFILDLSPASSRIFIDQGHHHHQHLLKTARTTTTTTAMSSWFSSSSSWLDMIWFLQFFEKRSCLVWMWKRRLSWCVRLSPNGVILSLSTCSNTDPNFSQRLREKNPFHRENGGTLGINQPHKNQPINPISPPFSLLTEVISTRRTKVRMNHATTGFKGDNLSRRRQF